VSEREADPILEREARSTRVVSALEKKRLAPDRTTVELLSRLGVGLSEETTLAGLLRRPGSEASRLASFLSSRLEPEDAAAFEAMQDEEVERLASDIRYDGYVARERDSVARAAASTSLPIPADFAYRGSPGLSAEAVEKLERHRPRTIGQAARIPGVTPAAVTILLARVLSARRAA